MPRGGYRPGAGRPRKAQRRSAKAPAVEVPPSKQDSPPPAIEPKTPLEFMLEVMNDTTQEATRRDRMAIAAAPFVHARAGESGKKDAKAEAARKVGQSGRFTSAPPPKTLVN